MLCLVCCAYIRVKTRIGMPSGTTFIISCNNIIAQRAINENCVTWKFDPVACGSKFRWWSEVRKGSRSGHIPLEWHNDAKWEKLRGEGDNVLYGSWVVVLMGCVGKLKYYRALLSINISCHNMVKLLCHGHELLSVLNWPQLKAAGGNGRPQKKAQHK